ncbi:MAG: protein kinase [Candidatus Hydrogenedentes bacterium]|nr:protein kinase [Candidatus Hydrogenedentota bacterium]
MAQQSEVKLAIAALQQGQIDAAAFEEILRRFEHEEGSMPDLLVQRGVQVDRALWDLAESLPHGVTISAGTLPLSVRAPAFEAEASTVPHGEDHDGSTIRAISAPAFGVPDEADLARTIAEVPGRYQSMEEYARGGMGRIIRVRDLFLDREIALKELLPGPVIRGMGRTGHSRHSSVARRLFLQEARTTGRLQHPSIVPVHEIGQRSDGTLYYTMKLVKGRPLSQAIRSAENLADRLALLPHFLDVCHAVAYAHSQGVIHRDLKPQNIMIGEFAETVVIDWGLALDMRACQAEMAVRPRRGHEAESDSPFADAMGTPAYMAPEQALGQHDRVSERSDIYALGAVLYKLLTGATPFKGTTTDDVLEKVVRESPRPVSELEPGVPPELVAVCTRAMAKNPTARFPSVLALAEEIERFQAGALLRSYRYNAKEYFLRWLKRNTAPVAVGAAAALALLLLTMYSYIQIVQQKNHAELARAEAEAASDLARMGMEEARRAQQQTEVSRQQAVVSGEAAERSLYNAYIGLAQSYMAQGSFERASELLSSCAPDLRNWEWGHLQYICNQDYHTFAIPAAGIRAEAAYGPPACFNTATHDLLIQQADGTLRVLDIHTGDLLRVIEGIQYSTYLEPFYSSDRRYLGLIDNDECQVRDSATFETLYRFPLLQHWQWRAQFSSDENFLAVRQQVDTVSVYDLQTGELAGSVVHSPVISRAALSGDGSLLAIFCAAGDTGTEGELRLVRLADGVELGAADGVQILDLQFEPGGSGIIVTNDAGVFCFRLESPDGPAPLAQTAGAATVAWNRDGSRVAVGTPDGLVVERSWPANVALRQWPAHRGAVRSLAYNRTSTRLATGGDDALVNLWDVDTGLLVDRFEGLSDPVRRLAFHQVEPVLFSASARTVKLWSLDRQVAPVDIDGPDALTAAWSESEVRLYTADRTGRVLAHDLTNGAARTVLDTGAVDTQEFALLSRDAAYLLAADADGFELWDVAGGRKNLERTAPGKVVHAAVFSRDSSLLAVMHGEKAVNQPVIDIFDCRSGEVFTSIRPFLTKDLDQYYFSGMDFSPDAKRLAVVTGDLLALFNIEDPSRIETIGLPSRAGTAKHCVVFDPAGRRVAVSGCENGVLLITIANVSSRRVLHGHSGPVTALCFSKDGQRLISGGRDGQVKVWDTESTQELVNWQACQSPVQYLLFAGPYQLAAGDGRNMTRLSSAFPWEDSALPGDALAPVGERIEAVKALDGRLNTDWGRCQKRLQEQAMPAGRHMLARLDDAERPAWHCEQSGELQWSDSGIPACSVHGPLWNPALRLDLMAVADQRSSEALDGDALRAAAILAKAVPTRVVVPVVRAWLESGRAGTAHRVCDALQDREGLSGEGFEKLAAEAAFSVGDLDATITHYRRLPEQEQVNSPTFHQALLQRRSEGDVALAYKRLLDRFRRNLPDDSDSNTIELLDFTRDPVDGPLKLDLRRMLQGNPEGWKSLDWYPDLPSAHSAATIFRRPILLELSVPATHATEWLHKRIYGHAAVWDMLREEFVLCRTSPEQSPDLVQRLAIQHFPALYVLDEAGDVLVADVEFSSPGALLDAAPPDIPEGTILSWRISGPHPVVGADEGSKEVPKQARDLVAGLLDGTAADQWYRLEANCYDQRLRFTSIANLIDKGAYYAWTRFKLDAADRVAINGTFSHEVRLWVDGNLVAAMAVPEMINVSIDERIDLEAGVHELLVELPGEARHIRGDVRLLPEQGAVVSLADMPDRPIVKNLARIDTPESKAPVESEAGVTRVRVRKAEVLEKWRANYLQYLALMNPRPYPDTGPIQGIQADNLSKVPLFTSMGLQDGDVITSINGHAIG